MADFPLPVFKPKPKWQRAIPAQIWKVLKQREKQGQNPELGVSSECLKDQKVCHWALKPDWVEPGGQSFKFEGEKNGFFSAEK
jgi:hypothetical protein